MLLFSHCLVRNTEKRLMQHCIGAKYQARVSRSKIRLCMSFMRQDCARSLDSVVQWNFLGGGNVLFCTNTTGTSHRWLLNTRNAASATEELNFKFSLILINSSSQMWSLTYHFSAALTSYSHNVLNIFK